MKFQNIKTLLKIYLLVLTIFSVFRLILFFIETDRLGESATLSTILQAFFMGVRFDTVISGYILSITFLLLSVQHLLNIQSKIFSV